MSRREATEVIANDLRGAHFVKTLRSGAKLWRGPSPHRLRYIVADDGGGLVCMTVLRTFDRRGSDARVRQ